MLYWFIFIFVISFLLGYMVRHYKDAVEECWDKVVTWNVRQWWYKYYCYIVLWYRIQSRTLVKDRYTTSKELLNNLQRVGYITKKQYDKLLKLATARNCDEFRLLMPPGILMPPIAVKRQKEKSRGNDEE